MFLAQSGSGPSPLPTFGADLLEYECGCCSDPPHNTHYMTDDHINSLFAKLSLLMMRHRVFGNRFVSNMRVSSAAKNFGM
jgi:hypothetical protein